MVRCALIMVMAVAAGCGNSPSPGGGKMDSGVKMDGSGSQQKDAATYNFSCGGNPACVTTDVCCTMPGASLTFGCVAPAACQQANQITCDGPEDCSGGTPICCGTDVPNGQGTYPSCGQQSIGTQCTTAANCATHLGTSCTQTSKVQLCKSSSDCGDPQDPMCCTFTSGAASLTFCIDSLTAQAAGATCH